MNVVICGDDRGVTRAYSADLLAGLAGFDDTEQFVAAIQRDEAVLKAAAASGDVLDEEPGLGGDSVRTLRQRLESQGHQVMEAAADLRAKAVDADFEESMRAGLGAVLMQAQRKDGIRRHMTAAAVTLATAVAMSLTAVTPEVHAQDHNQVSRAAKDTLGGIIGAAIGSKIGKGNGRKAAMIAGGALGVITAEAMQNARPNPPPQAAFPNDFGRQPFMGGGSPSLQSGTQALPVDHRERLLDLEINYAKARDAYAKALHAEQMAQDEAMLSPRNRDVAQRWSAATNVTKSASQQYGQVRNDFVSAVEYIGKRGFNVQEFSYSHSLAFSEVTPHDMSRADLASAQPRIQAVAPVTNLYNP